MFNFRIIETTDGNQIIDRQLKTPYNALTPSQMVKYVEMDNQLVYMDRLKKKAMKEADCNHRVARNPFYRLACILEN